MLKLIWIGYGKHPEGYLLALCWHENRQRAGDVAAALAQELGVEFHGTLAVKDADYESWNNFPDNHPLNKSRAIAIPNRYEN